jgi:gamma-glutamyltranspeptidase/glutathione hydrolase
MPNADVGERAMRPTVMGIDHVISSGHYLGAEAGLAILEAGGNAVDAGVAAGICAGVLESEFVSFAGVAPILIYLADRREVVTISGIGPWPKAATCELFQKRFGGAIPHGVMRSVVPSAPDAWITALERYGTMSFAEVAASAIRLARRGFAMYEPFHSLIRDNQKGFGAWPSTAAIFLPGGRVPQVGDVFVQDDLGRTLQFMADQESAAASKGRAAGLAAARDAFYRGDIAHQIVRFMQENDGLLTLDDLAGFRVDVEPAVRTRFQGIDVYACGPWSQGPMLLQELNLLDGMNVAGMGHNSAAYLHAIAEAVKLAAADRDAHYADPKFVDVPMDALLSMEYAAERRKMIRDREAWPDRPPPGRVSGPAWPQTAAKEGAAPGAIEARNGLDTSYVCVVDRHGNAFSATPSDGSTNDPIATGTGLFVSPRGSCSWADPAHPCSIAPGKRPRLTPNPALAIKPGAFVMPFGTPGGDVQTQAMLQVFLNITQFGMDPQFAVEVPRVASYSFPCSFEPHESYPGQLNIEPGIAEDVVDDLAARGHKIVRWPRKVHLAGSVCAIVHDVTRNVRIGAADPRRAAYAVGW